MKRKSKLERHVAAHGLKYFLGSVLMLFSVVSFFVGRGTASSAPATRYQASKKPTSQWAGAGPMSRMPVHKHSVSRLKTAPRSR